MKLAVIVFPGTSCEVDMYHAVKDVLGVEVEYVRHDATNLDGFDGVILPGGSSYGDYLRSGALAARTKVMEAVKNFAEEGKLVLGVSNGFQVLLEAGLLPGAMKQNENLKFICREVEVVVENNETKFTNEYEQGQVITLPIAHGFGNYYCDDETLTKLKENKQIVFKYKENVNGALENIAGIINEAGNVLGLMPHPERAVESLLGNEDGVNLFKSILRNWRETHVTTS